jgi:two-component system response regulator HydG
MAVDAHTVTGGVGASDLTSNGRVSVQDLTLRALFSTRDGLHQFGGVRVVLLDAEAIGESRKTMIDTVGLVASKRQILALGHSQGWRTASSLLRFVNRLAPRRLNSIVHRLLVLIGTTHTVPDEPDELTITLRDSCEALGVRRWGPTTEPACWFSVGFASGYFSRALGQVVVCREHTCVGRGDPTCRMHLEILSELWLDVASSEAPSMSCAYLFRHLGVDDAVISPTLPMGSDPASPNAGMHSPLMRALVMQAQRAAGVEATILITGESGVGKGHLARYIHDRSKRAKGPFLLVNCGALSESLLENELFGHRRGAFTGAGDDRQGLFEAAAGGTIFLDEIGELNPAMQVKLLDVLQSHQIRRLGDTQSRPVDVRVIAATNRDLVADVRAKRFREDLYYRLDVLPLNVPPLRDRPEDLRILADSLLKDAARRMNRTVVGYTAGAIEVMMSYRWPGNIRELENIVERLCALSVGTTLDVADLPAEIRQPAMSSSQAPSAIRPLRDVERDHILDVLSRCGGNRTQAAQLLGIAQDTLYRRLREYRLANEIEEPLPD